MDRPWWAAFIVQVGVPAAIALGLVFWLTTRYETRLVRVEERQIAVEKMMSQTLSMMQSAAESMHEFAQRTEQQQLRRDIVLRQICVNTTRGIAAAVCSQ